MRAAAHLTAIGLSAAILAISRPPSAGAAETNCAPLAPPIGSHSIARITVDSERHMAFIYTLAGSKLAVDASGDLVVWVVENKRQLAPEPNDNELDVAKEFAWKAAVAGNCAKIDWDAPLGPSRRAAETGPATGRRTP